MTAFTRRRRPLPFSRVERRDFDQVKAALEEQRDRAIASNRALRDAVAAWLEQRADAYQHDADHLERLKARPMDAKQRRAIADELRDCARDFEEELR